MPVDAKPVLDAPPRLHHEDLDVYKTAIEFLAFSSNLTDDVPRGNGALIDQLRRASLSIPLNIAEGAGRRGPADRARFYGIARGSAHECGAILDAARTLSVVDRDVYNQGKILLHRIVSMLAKMNR